MALYRVSVRVQSVVVEAPNEDTAAMAAWEAVMNAPSELVVSRAILVRRGSPVPIATYSEEL
jgi:hypothetical protein